LRRAETEHDQAEQSRPGHKSNARIFLNPPQEQRPQADRRRDRQGCAEEDGKGLQAPDCISATI
jgi:hypothetical protein